METVTEDVCGVWVSRPANIDKYTWAWMCDNFYAGHLQQLLQNAVDALKERCPFVSVVASGDVAFVGKGVK